MKDDSGKIGGNSKVAAAGTAPKTKPYSKPSLVKFGKVTATTLGSKPGVNESGTGGSVYRYYYS